MAQLTPEERRERYIEAWNKTMIEIWEDRIKLLGVYDTWALYRSLTAFPVHADGRFMSFDLSQAFLEYGLWQDLGTGREVAYGNPGDIGRDNKRERRRWFSTKYYRSLARLRDFMAYSMGEEFRNMITTSFSADEMRHRSEHYRRKGY